MSERIHRIPDKYILNLDTMNEFNPTSQALTRSGNETPKLLIENICVHDITTISITTAGGDKVKTTFVRKGETESLFVIV